LGRGRFLTTTPLATTTVLVIDDEPQIRRVVRNALEASGASVIEADTGRAGLDRAAAQRPQLIVLDLGLPDLNGISVCIEIRKWSNAPIVVLSARHSDAEKISLLDAGADDYVSKPFSTSELMARIRAQLRRSALPATSAERETVTLDGLELDLARRTAQRDGAEIHLTPIEWDLLRAFVRHAGRTLTHHQIFREVWRNAAGDAQSYLRVHIANLRRKIEPDAVRPVLIITEPGVGYRFRALE
jgi:two-component system, OmpR family, KDP operon response regulator KdpE